MKKYIFEIMISIIITLLTSIATMWAAGFESKIKVVSERRAEDCQMNREDHKRIEDKLEKIYLKVSRL